MGKKGTERDKKMPNHQGQGTDDNVDNGGDEVEALRRELDEVRQKGQEYLESLQRLQADFANYRRRIAQERVEYAKTGKIDTALSILPVLDDFERALDSIPKDIEEHPWVQGIGLVDRKLRAALEGQGISKIDALGSEFDPWEQEAVTHQPVDEDRAGKVVAVIRAGYRMDDRVIRPAQVSVGKKRD